jgi:hypothetical protein
MGHADTRWERSAVALAFGLTAGLGFVNVDLVFFTLSVVLNPSGLFRANPWYYPIPRLLWFAVGVFYAAFPRLPRHVRLVGAMGCCLYWLGWLTRDLIVIDRPLEVWVMWVGYIPLAVVSALLSWSNRRPNNTLERTGFAGRSA